MTLRTALTHYLDVTTPPPQTVLKQLAAIASDDNQRKALECLATVGSCFRLNFRRRTYVFENLVHCCDIGQIRIGKDVKRTYSPE